MWFTVTKRRRERIVFEDLQAVNLHSHRHVTRDVDMKHLRSRATSGARWTGTAMAVRVTLQFAQLAVLARLLRVEDFGLMAMVNVVLAFAQGFADSGVSNAIIHYREARREELSSLYWLNVLSGAVVAAIVWLAAPWLAAAYRQPHLVELLHVAAVTFVIGPFGQQFQALLERDLRFRILGVIEIAASITSAVVGIWLAYAGHGVWSLVWAALVLAATKSVLLAWVGWSMWKPMWHFAPRECRRFLNFGLFQMGERSLNLLGQQLDRIVIGLVLGPRSLGYYDLAYRLVSRPFLAITPVFSRVAFPVLSHVQKDRERLRRGYLELVEIVGAITIPIYVTMFVLAGPFITVQLGPDYQSIVGLLRILCLVGLALSINSPVGSLLMACGRADLGFYMNVLRTPILLAAAWIGSRWQEVGIAWGVVIVIVGIMGPLQAYLRWKLVGMRVGEFVARLAPYVWSSMAAAAVCVLLQRLVRWPNAAVELVVLLVAALGIYIGALAWRARPRLVRIITSIRT